jgi:hypothetical protein
MSFVGPLPPFAAKVAIIGTSGAHIRFVPGTLAARMVQDGSASAQPTGGKVREVTVSRTADILHCIGPGDGRAIGVRFFRTVRMDSTATRIFEHHPRCMW